MTDLDRIETSLTLATAVERFDQLRERAAFAGDDPALGRGEALELLALAGIIARKVGYGRQLDVRTARAAGASWSQIGAALGTSKQAAWEAHQRWIDEQAGHHGRLGSEGMDDETAAAARALAGPVDG